MLSVNDVIRKCNKEVASSEAKILVERSESKSVNERCRNDRAVSGDMKKLITSLAGMKSTEQTNNRIDKLDAAITSMSEKSKPMQKSMNTSIFSTESELLELCATVAKETIHTLNGNEHIDPETTAGLFVNCLDNMSLSYSNRDDEDISDKPVNKLLVLEPEDFPNTAIYNEYFEENDSNKDESFSSRMQFFDEHFSEISLWASQNRQGLFGSGKTRIIADEVMQPAMWEMLDSSEFMLPLVNVAKIEKIKKKPEKKSKDEKKEKSDLVKLTNKADATVQSEEVSIMKELTHVRKSLRETLKRRHVDMIPYYEFVLNPDDFSRTIENMFYVSYLIRDRECYLFYENNVPILKAAKYMDDKAKEKYSEEHSHHGIAQLSFKQWKKLGETYTSSCIEPKTI